MELYKYVVSARSDILSNKLIRFTPVDEFNDPFEGIPYIKGFSTVNTFEEKVFGGNFALQLKEKVSKKLGKNIPQEFIDVFLKNQIPHLIEEFDLIQKPFAKEFNSNFQQKLSALIGILCLTEKPDNLLMWAHYSEAHTGFVIKFNPNHNFFTESKKLQNEILHLTKVNYKFNRPNLFLTDIELSESLFIKSIDWEYEHEWRLCKPIGEATKKIVLGGKNIYLFQFPPDLITEVILGCRMSKQNEEEIKNIIKADPSLSHIKIRKMIPDEKEFRLIMIR